MKTLVLTVERKSTEIPWDGGTLQVEELSLRLPFARKPGNLREIVATGDDAVYVTETVNLTPEAFDGFASNLLASRDWLRGKGGYYAQGRLCVEVCAPGRPYLYVDPSGGDYARYVARLG
jgi:hypothetical protein